MTVDLFREVHPGLADRDVLFIHGNLASAVWWQPTLSEWRRQEPRTGLPGRLVFTDARGSGRNPAWPGDQSFSLEDLARDQLQVMNGLNMDSACLVGHSLGGLIALQMMILQPHRIAKAVLLDPVSPWGIVFDDALYDAFRGMGRDRELTRNVILGTITGREHLRQSEIDHIVDDAFKAVRGIGSSVLEIVKSVNLTDRVTSLQIPTLILHGELDQIIPLDHSRELARRWPKSRLETMSGVGHCWNVEDPAAFTARIRDWFK